MATESSRVSQSSDIMAGIPVFPGTRVPLQSLVEYLRAGEGVTAFLRDFPSVKPAQASEALAAGLEALISKSSAKARFVAERDVTQKKRSPEPRRDEKGVIINAEELTAEEVVRQPVRCPACSDMTFKTWPEGWDTHADKCSGLSPGSKDERKADYRVRYGHLFGESTPLDQPR